jgi:alpha/beta superfamily hydrolase
MPSQRLTLPVSHGGLEALLNEPERPRAAAVVCHPHPLQGGTMKNSVVHRLAAGLYESGIAALRFNFRGVGASTGSYGGATGEEEDVRAALDFLQARHPALPLWVAGFSFGARVGLSVGVRDPRVERLLGVGLAPSLFDLSFLENAAKPKAIIHAERDELASMTELRALFERMPEPKLLRVVPEATHLFAGKLDEVARAIREAIRWLESAPGTA